MSCGLASGNSMGMPVHTYDLRRSIYVAEVGASRSIIIGRIGLCDECISRLMASARM